jgi:two-component system cell cycle sensor histidine kinase/response regulator CckA
MSRKKTRILVVDDEQPVLDYIAKQLRTEGYDVRTAGSGEAALRLVADQALELDIVVTDLVLPGMTGFALADALRAANPKLKILFISGHTGAEYFRHMQLSAVDIPFLQKPFTSAALLEKLHELTAMAPPKERHTSRD